MAVVREAEMVPGDWGGGEGELGALVKAFKGTMGGRDRSEMRWAQIFFIQLTFPENIAAVEVYVSGLSFEVQKEKELVWKPFLKPKGTQSPYN